MDMGEGCLECMTLVPLLLQGVIRLQGKTREGGEEGEEGDIAECECWKRKGMRQRGIM